MWDVLSRLIEELSRQEMQDIIQEILDKKNKSNDKQWLEIVRDYDLECSPESLRKLSAGIKFADNAGMKFDIEDQVHMDKGFVERQKMYDIQRKIRQDMREFSRTELICEYITKAIESLPKIVLPKETPKISKDSTRKELVLGVGDFHYGANFIVSGLYGETINEYNSSVYERRMEDLLKEVSDIVEKEKPSQLTLMIAGDMLDGLLRTSQLQRLEYGVIDSAIHLAESLTYWLIKLERKINIPIRVHSVRGNHGEIRPLGTKAGQFPEENMERIVMHYLFARFDRQESVKIAQNDSPMMQIIDVCGYKFLLTHGHGMEIESMAKDCINLYHESIDVFMVGHLHKSQSFVSGILPETNVRVERVPSLCGVDPYAQSKGYSATAGATALLVEEGYGIKCIYPIVLK